MSSADVSKSSCQNVQVTGEQNSILQILRTICMSYRTLHGLKVWQLKPVTHWHILSCHWVIIMCHTANHQSKVYLEFIDGKALGMSPAGTNADMVLATWNLNLMTLRSNAVVVSGFYVCKMRKMQMTKWLPTIAPTMQHRQESHLWKRWHSLMWCFVGYTKPTPELFAAVQAVGQASEAQVSVWLKNRLSRCKSNTTKVRHCSAWLPSSCCLWSRICCESTHTIFLYFTL